MNAWRWLSPEVVYAIHDRQLAEHGGQDGLRDAGAIASALARPQNRAAYGQPDIADLAAAYAYGLAKNHGFIDGNKRTAWVAARLFLADNHHVLHFDPVEAVRVMEDVAAGACSEQQLAEWFRQRIVDT
ncbi:type II toxin-antitoxin system death-on-curing family toxin [Candidatus Glomeribacter gigasporarum]|uniref:type II toxin-antitoxin system death-on-curing family toxin n=1 Tax=Candidatus Glomeribacter gigasporarum TaxID=132144 RepID=UPI00031D4A0B|nr:type II toxin-antitoxin system death-on-curing family toxin [Candidatus Glomeribacter gigasporarum]